jgi:heme oxygenase
VISRLGERLKIETRALHVRAERSLFMAALLRGRLQRSAYIGLLHNLRAIYGALEPALQRHAAHPALARLDLKALARGQPLLDDLAALHDPSVSAAAPSLEAATARYVERLNNIAATQPELLLAHAYVRYLGDLNGGHVLRRIVAASLQLAPGAGTAFYDFGDPATVAAQAGAFHIGLDAARIDDNHALVEEAKLGFNLHCQLFDELAVAYGVRR